MISSGECAFPPILCSYLCVIIAFFSHKWSEIINDLCLFFVDDFSKVMVKTKSYYFCISVLVHAIFNHLDQQRFRRRWICCLWRPAAFDLEKSMVFSDEILKFCSELEFFCAIAIVRSPCAGLQSFSLFGWLFGEKIDQTSELFDSDFLKKSFFRF